MASTLGTALWEARGRRGISQRQLAAAAGITRGAVSHFETERHTPSVRSIEILAKALGVEFRCSGLGWSTGPAGEADELREALRAAMAYIDKVTDCNYRGRALAPSERFRWRNLAGLED